jgi:hypothetical protein
VYRRCDQLVKLGRGFALCCEPSHLAFESWLFVSTVRHRRAYHCAMRPEAEWLLIENVASARVQRGSVDEAEKQRLLTYHHGVLQGFRYLGAITSEEQSAWSIKMVDALGLNPPGAVGVTQVVEPSLPIPKSGAARPPAPVPGWSSPTRASRPRFLRYQAGPVGESSLHGGLLRVIAIEIYDTLTVVRWAASQEPDFSLVFPDEVAALEADVADLEVWAADELRKKTKQRLRMHRLFDFGLADDVSTGYIASGHRWGSGPEGATGEASFVPTVPLSAKTLTLEWFDLAIDIPLSPSTAQE